MTLEKALPLLMSLGLAIAGCGGDDDDDGGDSSARLCTAGMVVLEGTVDGASVSSSGESSSRLLNQLSEPPMLAVGWSGGSITFEWGGGLVANGETVDVTGIVTVDGASHCFGAGSQLTLQDNGFDHFTLQGLTEAPSTNLADCPGATTAAGTIEGCADAS